ncbi:MAG: type IV pilus assembly protein PilM [Elusimicrobiota bacterium]
MSPFFSGKQNILGVDLGTASVKVLEMKSSGASFKVTNYGQEDILRKGVSGKLPEERKEIYVNALKSILKRKKFSTKKAAVSISGSSVIVRFVKFPKMSAEDLSKTLQFEAEPHIPFDIDDVNMDTQIINEVEEENELKMETILVASKKDTVKERIDIIEAAGLKPAIIDVDAFALENAYEIINEQEAGDRCMLVNIGAAITNISIVEGGVSKVVRDLYTAGNAFTRAIQNSMKIEVPKAEELKKKYGLDIKSQQSSSEGDIGNQIYNILSPIAKELNSEMQRSIDYFTGQQSSPGAEINKIILSGGGALMRGLVDFIEADIKIPVEVFRPLEKAQLGDDSASLYVNSPALAVVTGLAVRKKGDSKQK